MPVVLAVTSRICRKEIQQRQVAEVIDVYD
jgi:hypothetical protein